MHLSGVIFNEEMKKAMLRPSNRKPINKLTNISNLQNETIAPRDIVNFSEAGTKTKGRK